MAIQWSNWGTSFEKARGLLPTAQIGTPKPLWPITPKPKLWMPTPQKPTPWTPAPVTQGPRSYYPIKPDVLIKLSANPTSQELFNAYVKIEKAKKNNQSFGVFRTRKMAFFEIVRNGLPGTDLTSDEMNKVEAYMYKNGMTGIRFAGLGGIDTQYAKSFLGANDLLTPLGIKNTINQIIADQKARVGRFFTYSQLLLDLQSRARGIAQVDATRGSLLSSRVQSAQQNQSRLESAGLSIFATLDKIQKDPLIIALTGGTTDTTQWSYELVNRGSQAITLITSLLSQSASLNDDIAKHERTIKGLESDIKSIEGDLLGKGIIKNIKSLASPLTDSLKYVGLGIGALAVIYVLGQRKK